MENKKRGISQITGKTEIKLGEKAFYKVTRIHRKEDNEKVKNALWKIYVNEKGNWRELKSDPSVPPKKGDEVSYTITNQALVGKELLVEAYIYEPEKKAPPGLKIKVVAGIEKKIQRVELFMSDDTPIKEDTILKYNQTIKVKVYTQNMPNELLKLTLYEDDADGGGHNPKNEKNKVAYKEKQTNDNGFLWHEFKLNAEFSKIANAMMDGSHDKLHEYYILVESVQYGRKTSKNVEVENPDYVVHQTYENGNVTDHKNDKIYEGGTIEEVIIKGKYKKQMGIDPIPNTGRSVSIVQEPPEAKKIANCGEKYCIKIGDKNELIREINIRLAGFGGNIPTDEFTDRTEKMIRQFQRDYMKVPETGKVCGNVLRAIDEFGNKYTVDINEGKCPCKECNGFGNGLNSNERGNSKILEMYRKYEYPGIHRTLIWVEKAIKFYLANQEKSKKLRVGLIFSGYRCNANNRQKGRKSTNHMGKALDLHIYGVSNTSNTEATANTVRDLLLKYTKAEYRWKGKNVIALEPSTRNRIGKEFIATTWVHYDVRTFDLEYLKDEYFVKNNNGVNGEPIFQLASKLGFSQTCSCLGSGESAVNEREQKGKDERVDPKTLKASDEIVEFIKDWEKYRKMPYNDSKGYCTVGYGHLIKKKKCEDIVIPTEFKDGVSETKATELFKEDLKEFEMAVQRDVTVKLYQREFDALIDLLFNCGQYFLSSGKAPKLYKNLLDEKYEDAAKEFLDIENRTRRKQNYEIFINGNYDSTH